MKRSLIERYDLSGSVYNRPGATSHNSYMYPIWKTLPPPIEHYDIACSNVEDKWVIWIATSISDSVIMAYDSNKVLIDYILESDLPTGIKARGLCFDTDGYLWVSDESAGKIYKISVQSVGIKSENHISQDQSKLSILKKSLLNQFIITLNGVTGPASLVIYDISGKSIFKKEMLDGLFAWNCQMTSGQSVPNGAYIIKVTLATGKVMSRLITKF